jgi:hypothetical protein
LKFNLMVKVDCQPTLASGVAIPERLLLDAFMKRRILALALRSVDRLEIWCLRDTLLAQNDGDRTLTGQQVQVHRTRHT